MSSFVWRKSFGLIEASCNIGLSVLLVVASNLPLEFVIPPPNFQHVLITGSTPEEMGITKPEVILCLHAVFTVSYLIAVYWLRANLDESVCYSTKKVRQFFAGSFKSVITRRDCISGMSG